MYSAIKVDGKRLYKAAREGKVVERKTRSVNVAEFYVERDAADPQLVHFRVVRAPAFPSSFSVTLTALHSRGVSIPIEVSRDRPTLHNTYRWASTRTCSVELWILCPPCSTPSLAWSWRPSGFLLLSCAAAAFDATGLEPSLTPGPLQGG